MGIIGKTQGVSKAANPLKKAMKNILHIPFLLDFFSAGSCESDETKLSEDVLSASSTPFVSTCSDGAPKVKEKSTYSGGKH